MDRTTIVLCPLVIERRAAARATRDRAVVITTGPGPVQMRHALESIDFSGAKLLVLFGVAGALVATDIAPAIATVIDGATGRAWAAPGAPSDGAKIAGVAAPLLTPQAKRSLRGSTGADLVDTESHIFASTCAERGVNWTIIRGVSDGPDDTLPANIGAWVDERGRTRPGRVALDLARRPSMVRQVRRLGRTTNTALRAAAAQLDALLTNDAATIATA